MICCPAEPSVVGARSPWLLCRDLPVGQGHAPWWNQPLPLPRCATPAERALRRHRARPPARCDWSALAARPRTCARSSSAAPRYCHSDCMPTLVGTQTCERRAGRAASARHPGAGATYGRPARPVPAVPHHGDVPGAGTEQWVWNKGDPYSSWLSRSNGISASSGEVTSSSGAKRVVDVAFPRHGVAGGDAIQIFASTGAGSSPGCEFASRRAVFRSRHGGPRIVR